MDLRDLFERRLLLVSGKGGVGKSTAAAALALAAARFGRRTCLVEVEGRQTFSAVFDTAPWDFTEREFRPGLWGMSIDPEASLQEYLALFYGAQRLSRLVAKAPAVEFATQAAPGIKDVLLIGKVKEMERRRDPDGRFHYDLIVMDAPPTGRIVNFLRAPDATTELVNLGPIRAQAQTVIEMILDAERTNLVLVTLLEEMPVTETIESVEALDELGVALGPVLVNRVTEAVLDAEEVKALADLNPDDVVALAGEAALELDGPAAADLLELGADHLARLELEERMRERLAEQLDLPTLELPYVTGQHASDVVAALAGRIELVVEP